MAGSTGWQNPSGLPDRPPGCPPAPRQSQQSHARSDHQRQQFPNPQSPIHHFLQQRQAHPQLASWQLNSSWIGDTPRQNNFRPNPALPENWYKVKSSDYSGSGYDRGHMVASADRDRSADDQSTTYLMTNIVPQAPDNNQGPWAEFEIYCRTVASKGKKELAMIAGPYGSKGVLAKGKVNIPETVWKVVVIMDSPGQVDENTRVIALEMPNSQGISRANWRDYRVSVDSIESKTGYDLLSDLPSNLQNKLESQADKR
ncbi:MAG: DNA/RNA non-specific endonuclease [Alkalinema sp. RU_4_3]|nr:DNA/RNA non-specific endonuclease [Alkalinema sp. RU_4_3]